MSVSSHFKGEKTKSRSTFIYFITRYTLSYSWQKAPPGIICYLVFNEVLY